MSDVSESDDGVEQIAAPQSTRWTTTISASFFNAVATILSDAAIPTITESDFRTALVDHMLEQHSIVIDHTKIVKRVAEAKKHVDGFAQLQRVFDERHRGWEERRDAFLAAQNERRETRVSKAARRRHAPPVVHSDSEFDEDEPLLQPSGLQQARVDAIAAYEQVRARFEAERKQQRADRTEAAAIARREQRISDRRRAVLSTLSAVLPDEAADPAPMDDSASSGASSSSSPAKRKFNAAAVVGVYTEFVAAAVANQATLADELRRQIQEQAAATAAYRERKIKGQEEYWAAKLRLLGADKENRNPNSKH